MWIVCTFKPVLSCIVNYWDHLQCWSDILAPSPLLSEGGGGSEGEGGDFSPLCTFVWIHVDWLQACSVISPTCFVIFLYCQLLGSPNAMWGQHPCTPPLLSEGGGSEGEGGRIFSPLFFFNRILILPAHPGLFAFLAFVCCYIALPPTVLTTYKNQKEREGGFSLLCTFMWILKLSASIHTGCICHVIFLYC